MVGHGRIVLARHVEIALRDGVTTKARCRVRKQLLVELVNNLDEILNISQHFRRLFLWFKVFN